MLTDEQARALRAIRDDDPLVAVKARVGVDLRPEWVVVPAAAGEPPFLSSFGERLLDNYDALAGK